MRTVCKKGFNRTGIGQVLRTTAKELPSFSSKRGHVTVKHVLTGRKHDKLGNQTFEVLAVKTKGKYDTFHVFHLLVE